MPRWLRGAIEIPITRCGIPEEKVRFHTCYSFDAAPRVGDMELKDILDLILRINCGSLFVEGPSSP